MDIRNFLRNGIRLHEVNTEDKKVKTAGYIPRRERIEALLDAGNRLVDYRERTFMYKDDSLAQKDSSMPSDIFQDEIENLDARREFEAAAAAKQKAMKSEESEPKADASKASGGTEAKPTSDEEPEA